MWCAEVQKPAAGERTSPRVHLGLVLALVNALAALLNPLMRLGNWLLEGLENVHEETAKHKSKE